MNGNYIKNSKLIAVIDSRDSRRMIHLVNLAPAHTACPALKAIKIFENSLSHYTHTPYTTMNFAEHY